MCVKENDLKLKMRRCIKFPTSTTYDNYTYGTYNDDDNGDDNNRIYVLVSATKIIRILHL